MSAGWLGTTGGDGSCSSCDSKAYIHAKPYRLCHRGNDGSGSTRIRACRIQNRQAATFSATLLGSVRAEREPAALTALKTEQGGDQGRIGLIGAGDFGLFCMEAFAATPDLRVVAVADPRPDLDSRLAASPTISKYADWREMLTKESLEVLHIATPPWTHAEIAMVAAQDGVSVFVEKPLALSLSDADEMIATFSARKLALGINYVMRHSPIYRLLIDLTQQGLMGKVRRISLGNGAKAVPEGHWFWDRSKSGGILVEHGVHFFDVFRQLAGEGEATYTVDGGNRILAEIHYQQGAWGSNYHDFSLDERVESLEIHILFEAGSARIHGWIPEWLELTALAGERSQLFQDEAARYQPARATVNNDGTVSITSRLPDRRASYLKAIAQGMRQTVAFHRDPAQIPEVSPEDARESLAVAIAAQAMAVPPRGA